MDFRAPIIPVQRAYYIYISDESTYANTPRILVVCILQLNDLLGLNLQILIAPPAQLPVVVRPLLRPTISPRPLKELAHSRLEHPLFL